MHLSFLKLKNHTSNNNKSLYWKQGSETSGLGATCGPHHPYWLTTVYTSVCIYAHSGSRNAATWVYLVVQWKASVSSNLCSRLFVLQYLKFKNTNTVFFYVNTRVALTWDDSASSGPQLIYVWQPSFKVLKKLFRIWPRGFKRSYKLAWVPTQLLPVLMGTEGMCIYVHKCLPTYVPVNCFLQSLFHESVPTAKM